MTTLEILRSGPLALVEDLGRAGLAHLGVGRSGAADRRSHTLANRLVANPDDWAARYSTAGRIGNCPAKALPAAQSRCRPTDYR